MESYAAPLRALAAELNYFVRAREVRVFHLVAGLELRDAAIQVAMAQEYHADNHSPFVRLDAPHSPREGAWSERTRALLEHEEHWVRAMTRARVAVPPRRDSRAPGADDGQPTPLVEFAAAAWRLAHRGVPGVEGLVLLLCPTDVASVPAWSRDLRQLFETSWLQEVRWIVVDAAGSSLRGVLEPLGAAAMQARVTLNEWAVRRDLEQKVEAAANAPEQSPGPARAGAAWPPEPPPRAPQPPLAERTAQLVAAGVPAALANPAIARLRPMILRGAAAMRRGDAHGAVRHQADAVQLARSTGLGREAAVLELVLGTYVDQTGEVERAHEIYAGVAERATEQHWYDVAAQALMARGAMRVVERRRDEAAAIYAQAGTVAARGHEDSLAIESFRMAGQLRAEARDEEQAIRLWARAVELAGGIPIDTAGQTSAPMAARALADVIRRRGLRVQAQSLLEQAERMEHAAGRTA